MASDSDDLVIRDTALDAKRDRQVLDCQQYALVEEADRLSAELEEAVLFGEGKTYCRENHDPDIQVLYAIRDRVEVIGAQFREIEDDPEAKTNDKLQVQKLHLAALKELRTHLAAIATRINVTRSEARGAITAMANLALRDRALRQLEIAGRKGRVSGKSVADLLKEINKVKDDAA